MAQTGFPRVFFVVVLVFGFCFCFAILNKAVVLLFFSSASKIGLELAMWSKLGLNLQYSSWLTASECWNYRWLWAVFADLLFSLFPSCSWPFICSAFSSLQSHTSYSFSDDLPLLYSDTSFQRCASPTLPVSRTLLLSHPGWAMCCHRSPHT